MSAKKPPKPPSSPHWAPVDSPTFQEQSVCLAVGFTTDGQTGFAGAGSNGVGAQIIKSIDGGKTWAPTPGQNASFNIYLDASAAVSETLPIRICSLLHGYRATLSHSLKQTLRLDNPTYTLSNLVSAMIFGLKSCSNASAN